MTKAVSKNPNLRFIDQDGQSFPDWEEKQLGDISIVNPPNEPLPEKFTYINLESVVKGVLISRISEKKETAPSRAQRVLKKGDVLFQMVRPYQKNNLFFKFDGDFVASTGYAQLRIKTCNQAFLFHLIHIPVFVNRVLAYCTGTSYPSINTNDLAIIGVNIPHIKEQQKIANALSSVDAKISALKRKLDLMKEYKKGLMQKMFSRELRFTDKNGKSFPDWKEKKLGEISNISTGNSNRQDSLENGKYAFFDRSEKVRTSNRYLFNCEAIIVPGEGQDFIPKYFIGKFDLHQRTYAITKFKKNYGKFLYYSITYFRNHFLSYAVGSTVKSLRLPIFKKMKLFVPSINEQRKIAYTLSCMDKKIETISNQIEKIELFKKGLLQQMFI